MYVFGVFARLLSIVVGNASRSAPCTIILHNLHKQHATKIIFLLYADDLKIFKTIENIVDCHCIRELLNSVIDFCQENSLYLNVYKCFSMSFARNTDKLLFDYYIENISQQYRIIIQCDSRCQYSHYHRCLKFTFVVELLESLCNVT